MTLTYCSCKPNVIISVHHYPAFLIITSSCLWTDPNCPPTMNITEYGPRCTVIFPPHQDTKTRNREQGREFGPFVSFPLFHGHGGFEAYRSGSESDWACSVRLVLQDRVAQITPRDPFVGVFINPNVQYFGFVNERWGHWLDSSCQHHLSLLEYGGWQLRFLICQRLQLGPYLQYFIMIYRFDSLLNRCILTIATEIN